MDIVKVGIAVLLSLLLIFGVLHLVRVASSPSVEEIVTPSVFVPVPEPGVSSPTISAEAYVLVYVGENAAETILAERNSRMALPIASVTKLMTAYVASGAHTSDDTLSIPSVALTGRTRANVYTEDTKLFVDDALRALLISSHNEIAEAFAASIPGGESVFIARMNWHANHLGLTETSYVNPSGLDPEEGTLPVNRASAYDTYRLIRAVEGEKPLLFETLGTASYELADSMGARITSLASTNELLGQTVVPFTVIAGKTGETPRAKQALVIVATAPCGGTLYSVVLRSSDRAADMRALLSYASGGFSWICEK